MTSSLAAHLKDRAIKAAEAMNLPLGWHGDPFIVPEAPHVRGRIFFDSSRCAGVLGNPYTRIAGRMALTVFTPVNEDSQAVSLIDGIAAFFPRGDPLAFENGTGTITTTVREAPASDGKRCFAAATIPFYAFIKE